MERQTNASRDRFFSDLPALERLVFQNEVIVRLTREVHKRNTQIWRVMMLASTAIPAVYILKKFHAPKPLILFALCISAIGFTCSFVAFILFREFEENVDGVKQLYLDYEKPAEEQYPIQYPIVKPTRTEKL